MYIFRKNIFAFCIVLAVMVASCFCNIYGMEEAHSLTKQGTNPDTNHTKKEADFLNNPPFEDDVPRNDLCKPIDLIKNMYSNNVLQKPFDLRCLPWRNNLPVANNDSNEKFSPRSKEELLKYVFPHELFITILSRVPFDSKPSSVEPVFKGIFTIGENYMDNAQVSSKLLLDIQGKEGKLRLYPGMYVSNVNSGHSSKELTLEFLDSQLKQKSCRIVKSPSAQIDFIDGIGQTHPIAFGISEKNNASKWIVALNYISNRDIYIAGNSESALTGTLRLSGKGTLQNVSLYTKQKDQNKSVISLVVATSLKQIKIFNISESHQLGVPRSSFIDIGENFIDHKTIDIPEDLWQKNSKIFDILFAVTQKTLVGLSAGRMYVIALDEGEDRNGYTFYLQRFSQFKSVKYISKDPENPVNLLVLSKEGYICLMSLKDRSLTFLHSDPLAERVRFNGDWIMIEQKERNHEYNKSRKVIPVMYFSGQNIMHHRHVALSSSDSQQWQLAQKSSIGATSSTTKSTITVHQAQLIKKVAKQEEEIRQLEKQNKQQANELKKQKTAFEKLNACVIRLYEDSTEAMHDTNNKMKEIEKLKRQSALFRRQAIRYGIAGGVGILVTGGIIGYAIAAHKSEGSFIERSARMLCSVFAGIGKIFSRR